MFIAMHFPYLFKDIFRPQKSLCTLLVKKSTHCIINVTPLQFPRWHPVQNDIILLDDIITSLDSQWLLLFGLLYILGHKKYCFPLNFAFCRLVVVAFGQERKTFCFNDTPERFLQLHVLSDSNCNSVLVLVPAKVRQGQN